uniref:ARAD1C40480p n=1 Tax=Blastobotrys adeninivorans TaxID=409370 RepID=A0A060T9V2_BLAAD
MLSELPSAPFTPSSSRAIVMSRPSSSLHDTILDDEAPIPKSKSGTNLARKPKQFVAHSRHGRTASSTKLTKMKGGDEFRRTKSTENMSLRRSRSKLAPMHPVKPRPPLVSRGSGGPEKQPARAVIQLDHESDDDEDEVHHDSSNGTNGDNDQSARSSTVDLEAASREDTLEDEIKQHHDLHHPNLPEGSYTKDKSPVKHQNDSDTQISNGFEKPDRVRVPSKSSSSTTDIQASSSNQNKSDTPDMVLRPALLKGSKSIPPQVSTETVVALSDASPQPLAKTDSSTDLQQSQFFDKSEASPDARFSATRTQQKLWLQRDLNFVSPSSSVILSSEQRRDLERIAKEYMSIKKYASPYLESLDRISIRQRQYHSSAIPKSGRLNDANGPGLSQSLPKRVSSLSATTLNKQDLNSSSPSASSTNISLLLNKLWLDDGTADRSPSPQSISSQAQAANAKLSRPRAMA